MKRFQQNLLLTVLMLLSIVNTPTFARQKIGLVLGGGGAKGAAHIGALKVLEEAGVKVDYIVGTSIGAIVGGMYAAGYKAEQLEQLFRQQAWLNLFANETLAAGHIEAMFDDVICKADSNYCRTDSLQFDQLRIPYRCVTVDIRNMEEVVLAEGKLAKAMRASMAVPIALRAVEIDGRKLVDGGMLNNLPVDVARAMGADIVIAIDLQQAKHKTREFSLKEKIGIGGVLDWLISRPDWRRYNDNRADADIYINPDLNGFSATDFQRTDIEKMIIIGEKAARQQTKKLKKIKKTKRRK